MNFTPCHRNAGLPKFYTAVKLTRKDCIERFQKIHAENPKFTDLMFRTVADLTYPENCRIKKVRVGKMGTQKIWDDTLEKFLADRRKLLDFQNG